MNFCLKLILEIDWRLSYLPISKRDNTTKIHISQKNNSKLVARLRMFIQIDIFMAIINEIESKWKQML